MKKMLPFPQLVIDHMCFCPSDCESTNYIIEFSTSERSINDTALLIRSYTKKNKILYNVGKENQKSSSPMHHTWSEGKESPRI